MDGNLWNSWRSLINVVLNAAIDWWRRIEIGDLHFCWGFLAWEGWLLELLNASVEVVFGGFAWKGFGEFKLMIGRRRVLWGNSPVDLSAVWEHYWTTTSICALAGLLASEILYWRWGIHTHIHTYIHKIDMILSLWVSQLPFCCLTLCCACIMLYSVDVCVWESWFGDEVITMLKAYK
jgi:hypothetical protein